MTTLDYLEKVDDTLAHWEDYFHGQEGTDVTEARANLDKVRKQLLIHSVVVPNESEGTLPFDFIEWYSGMERTKIENAYKRWLKEKR